jgi:hypothetical protein
MGQRLVTPACVTAAVTRGLGAPLPRRDVVEQVHPGWTDLWCCGSEWTRVGLDDVANSQLGIKQEDLATRFTPYWPFRGGSCWGLAHNGQFLSFIHSSRPVGPASSCMYSTKLYNKTKYLGPLSRPSFSRGFTKIHTKKEACCVTWFLRTLNACLPT